MTAFIGKNDTGKSSFLDALDTFFNHSKLDIQDRCVYSPEAELTSIGCVFSGFPEEIILDETVRTTFADEYLLNTDGFLEIWKQFNSTGKQTVYINAYHPNNPDVSDLLNKKNIDLKRLVQQNNLQNTVNLTINKDMRKALWELKGNELTFSLRLIPADKEDAKNIWEKVQKLLPRFALFKADRPSTDEDNEAQDPIQLAVKKALENQREELEKIKNTVMEYVETVASNTINKLKDFDDQVASQLSPSFKKEPSWDKAFSFSMFSDDSIPINKRGSGIRRLVLFSFFRANIENELDIDSDNGIIYAVEEPETSQHPDFQKVVVETFLRMVDNPLCQVILTTHVPGLAGLLPIESLRHVVSTENSRAVYDSSDQDEEILISNIASTLGVYPSISQETTISNSIKLIICVEGPNDVEFFKVLSRKLNSDYDEIISIDSTDSILIIPLGGGTLQHWVDYNYLTKLGITEYHIYDRDDDAKYQRFCDTVNNRGNGSSARLTSKRETENYIHPDAIENIFGVRITVNDDTNVPFEISQILKERNEDGSSESKVKVKLNKDTVELMSKQRLLEIDQHGEVISWLTDIKNIINS